MGGLALIREFADEGFGIYVAGEVIDSDPEEFHLIEVDGSGFAASDFQDVCVAVEGERLGGVDMVSLVEDCFVNDITLGVKIAGG